MFINGNLIGFGMFIAVGIIIAIGAFVLKLPNAAVMITAGLALSVIDLILRSVSRSKPGWLMKKEHGGYLFFIPVWIFGVVVAGINIINIFVNSPK